MGKSQIKTSQKLLVIASTLKPINDTRMFEKIGVTLAVSGLYEIWIMGYPANQPMDYTGIHFLPHNKFTRLSWERFTSPFKIFKKILEVKPELLIINTHELLIVAFLNRILFGTKIIYDIQENYYRNLLHTNAFPFLIRTVLALWVRLKEKLTAPFFQWFFLAEKGYENEMSFFGSNYIIIENKSIVPKELTRTKVATKSRLLFSGTLAESTGVFHAIQLAKILHQADSKIELTIIGYAAQSSTLLKIKETIRNQSFIRLIGGDHLVPHDQIMKAIFEADFGIICYPFSPHTQNSVPTKLYEYLACRLPILLQNHRPWIELCLPIQAAISIDFDKIMPIEILDQMKGDFYLLNPEDVTWESEAPKLLQAVDRTLKQKML